MNWFPVKDYPLERNLSDLTHYLRERGLVHRISEEGGRQVLFVVDESVIPALLEFLQEYEKGGMELHVQPVAPPSNLRTLQFFQDIKSTPVVTILIVLSIIGTFLTQTRWGSAYLSFVSFQDFTATKFVPLADSLLAGEIWRLLTPVFIHFGLFHVLFNSLWMWDFGRRLESLLGTRHFLLFFILCGIASNIAQFLWSGSAIFGGMSGVVYALVGFIAVRQKIAPHPLIAVPPALIGFMLFWLVLCMTGVVDYFIAGSVANAAHVGGLIAGALYAYITRHFFNAIND